MDEITHATQILSSIPYGSIFLLFLVVNIFVPFPEEVFLIALGYVASKGVINIYFAGFLAFLGLLASDYILYLLARSDKKIIAKMRNRFLKHVVGDSEATLRKNIKNLIFYPRFLMGFRGFGPILSGTLKIPRRTFLVYDAAAIFVFVTTLIFLGDYYSDRISRLVDNVGTIRQIAFMAFGILILSITMARLHRYIFRFFRKLRSSGTGGSDTFSIPKKEENKGEF